MVMGLIAVLGLPARPVEGLTGNNEGVWQSYTMTHGLPFNRPSKVQIDENNQAWVGFGSYSILTDSVPINPLVAVYQNSVWVTHTLPGCDVNDMVTSSEGIFVSTRCQISHGQTGTGLFWYVDDQWVSLGDDLGYGCVSEMVTEDDTHLWMIVGYFGCRGSIPTIRMLDHQGTADKSDDIWQQYFITDTIGVTETVSNISQLGIAPDGSRWFGTIREGVFVLLADNETWVFYPPELIPSVYDIAFDGAGNVWLEISSNEEVMRFDGNHWSYYASRQEAVGSNFEALMASPNQTAAENWFQTGLWVVEEPAGVWLPDNRSHYGQGIYFYDGMDWTYYSYDNSGLLSDKIVAMAVDQQNSLWLTTAFGYMQPWQAGVNVFIPEPDIDLSSPRSVLFLPLSSTQQIPLSLSLLRGWVPSATLQLLNAPEGVHTSLATEAAIPSAPALLIPLTMTIFMTTPLGLQPLTVLATSSEVTVTATVDVRIVEVVYRSFFPFIQN